MKRFLASVPVLSVLALLSGCLGPEPRLLVVPEGAELRLSLSSERSSGSFGIGNGGEVGSVLDWSVHSSSPKVLVTPSAGSLRAGDEPQAVRVRVDQSGLSRGEVLRATLQVRSNGGNQSVPLDFAMLSDGLDRCGAFPDGISGTPMPRAEPRRGRDPDDELLVQYRTSGLAAQSLETPPSEVRTLERAVAERYGLAVLKRASSLRPALVRVPEGEDALATARRLTADPRVLYAEPNYRLEPLALPDDAYLADQWNLLDFGVPQAWDLETGRNEVVVAIVDSGVDLLHEDLAEKMLPGCDFYDGDNDPNPGSSGVKAAHGTHVAGIAAAIGDNGLGVAGVAYGPGVKLLPVKVFDDLGVDGTVDDLLDAMLWAAGLPVEGAGVNRHPAKVINMSLGVDPGDLGQSTLHSIDEVAKRVFDHGAVLFAASGNRGLSDRILAPASSPWVYGVGSVDGSYRLSSFSNYATDGDTVDFVAPGGSSLESRCTYVYSTYPDDAYACEGGTSMAAPFVAGTAALLLSQDPALTPAQIESKLRASTFFDPGYMTTAAYGNGVVCPDRALGAPTRCGR